MPERSWTWSSLLAALCGYGLVLLVGVGAPLAAHARGAPGGGVIAEVFALCAAAAADRLGKRPAAGVLGVVAAGLGLVLLTQARQGATSWVLAACTGAGVG